MHEHFGRQGADTFARDQVITDLGGRTVHEALADGVPTRQVWDAVCEWADVPPKLR